MHAATPTTAAAARTSGRGAAPKFQPITGYWRNPAVVAAKFPLQGGHPGRAEYGVVYRDGSCSCGAYKRSGDCRHARAWREQGGSHGLHE